VLIVGWIFLALGLISMLIGTISYLRMQHFIARALKAEGTVLRLVEKSGKDWKAFVPVFEFSDVSGKSHTVYSQKSSYPPSYRVGDSVEVLYEADTPKDARLNKSSDLWGTAYTYGPGGVRLFLVGLGIVIFMRATSASARQPQRPAESSSDDADVEGS
jgi:hypothetical protein